MSSNSRVTDQEIAAMRQNMSLLRSQVQAGRVDASLLLKQIENLTGLLERVDADRKEYKKEARFEALYNVSRLIGSSLELQTVLNQVMDAIIKLTGAERGFLMLRDDDGGLSVKAARNLDQQTLGSDSFKYSRTIANQVLDSSTPIVTTNATEDPRFAGQASIVTQALRSIMATPLRARGNVVGVAYVDSRAVAGLFDQNDLDALDALTSQAAIALENARLFAETDLELARRVEELQQLRRVDRLLNETLDADKAMLYTMEWACRLSLADSGHLGLLEGDPPRVLAIHHHGAPENEQPAFLDEAFPTLAEVVKSDKTLAASDEAKRYTLLLVPVHREQKVIGAVVLKRRGANAFTDDQRDIVERLVDRAAVAIENARLYAAVQTADRAKSEFVGIVAHDLKTPMTSIAGYADLSRITGPLNERQAEFVEKIKDTVKRMEILVSDLADISRIESGHFFMEPTRVVLVDIIQAVKDNTMPQIQARGHTMAWKVEEKLPDLWVDYYRLLQVLTNLVSNAYKYTPNGGTITLSARRVGDAVEFSVADTGIGLSREQIKMLGTKFWRAEDEYTRSQPGTGLGFAITRNLVEQMGGQIAIESEVGKGSTFTFSVPVAKT